MADPEAMEGWELLQKNSAQVTAGWGAPVLSCLPGPWWILLDPWGWGRGHSWEGTWERHGDPAPAGAFVFLKEESGPVDLCGPPGSPQSPTQVFFFSFFFLLHRWACVILVPRPGIEPRPGSESTES